LSNGADVFEVGLLAVAKLKEGIDDRRATAHE
jgi:hypothetical protein